MTDQEIFTEAIRRWGAEAQIHQAVEECAELIVAVNKVRRAKDREDQSRRELELCGEIADVLNCMEQMRMTFGAEDVDRIRKEKMERLKQRLGL